MAVAEELDPGYDEIIDKYCYIVISQSGAVVVRGRSVVLQLSGVTSKVNPKSCRLLQQ